MLKRMTGLLLALLLTLTAAAALANSGYDTLRDTYAAEAGWGEPVLTEAMDLEDAKTVRIIFFLGDGFVALYGRKADGGCECTAWAMDNRDQLARMYVICTAFDDFSLLCGGHFALGWTYGEAAEGVITSADEAAEYAEAILPMLEASDAAK